MPSIGARKSLSAYKSFCNKCRSNISPNTSGLSVRMNDSHSYEDVPSPSSIASASTIEQSLKERHRILSSTLKNDHSHLPMKRRSRFEKLFHHTQLINRQYMVTMTNILFQMQKEIYKLRKRTNRVEQSVVQQTKSVQPIIRIPRLTKDQLSTICIHDEENVSLENDVVSDDTNDDVEIMDQTKSKSAIIKRSKGKHKNIKNSVALSKKPKHIIWINNRQKSIDPDKYCTVCRYEFAKRFNYQVHVRTVHKGKYPPKINEQDQSLLGMNEENAENNFTEQSNNPPNETTDDQSAVIFDGQTEPLEVLSKKWNMGPGRLRSRTNTKVVHESNSRTKIKCYICNKFYRTDYMKKHIRRAHPDQQILLTLSEINNNSDPTALVSDKPTDQCHLSDDNPASVDGSNTPTTITIAEMDVDDVPILFRPDSNRSIVIAVTCLESYQLELVDKFLEKFSSCVCQTSSIDSRTTHLITNDEHNSLRSPLSMKLIEAIAHHCFCVSYRWIVDCLQHERIMDEVSYEIEGDDTDIHPHGGPRRSRLISNRHTLFQNICFMIKCTENSDIQMTNERLEDLINTCGGQIITCVTQRLLDKHQIIVLCDMMYVSERRQNYDQCRSLGIHFVSSDWVLESILEYRRKPFSLFEEVPL